MTGVVNAKNGSSILIVPGEVEGKKKLFFPFQGCLDHLVQSISAVMAKNKKCPALCSVGGAGVSWDEEKAAARDNDVFLVFNNAQINEKVLQKWPGTGYTPT